MISDPIRVMMMIFFCLPHCHWNHRRRRRVEMATPRPEESTGSKKPIKILLAVSAMLLVGATINRVMSGDSRWSTKIALLTDTRAGGEAYDGTHNVPNSGIPLALRGKISPDCDVLPRKDCLPAGISREWRHGDPIVRVAMDSAKAPYRSQAQSYVATQVGDDGSKLLPPAVLKAFQRAEAKWGREHVGKREGRKSSTVSTAHTTTTRAAAFTGKADISASKGKVLHQQVQAGAVSVMRSVREFDIPANIMAAFANYQQDTTGLRSKNDAVLGGSQPAPIPSVSAGGKIVLSPLLAQHLRGLESNLEGEIQEIRSVLSSSS